MKTLLIVILLCATCFLFAEDLPWGMSRAQVLSRYSRFAVVEHPNPNFNPDALSFVMPQGGIVSFTFDDSDSLVIVGYFGVFPLPKAKRLFEEIVQQFTAEYGEPEILNLLPYHKWATAQENISLLLSIDEIWLTFSRLNQSSGEKEL